MRFLLLLSFIFSLHIFSEPEQDFYLECKNSFGWFDRINEKHIFFYSKDTKELKWHSIISMGTKKNFLFSFNKSLVNGLSVPSLNIIFFCFLDKFGLMIFLVAAKRFLIGNSNTEAEKIRIFVNFLLLNFIKLV